MRSANSDRAYRDQNDSDFRRMVKANRDRIREDDLRRLASLVWEGGANEIVRFVEIAVSDKPFPT
jgi:hypothetical protein